MSAVGGGEDERITLAANEFRQVVFYLWNDVRRDRYVAHTSVGFRCGFLVGAKAWRVGCPS